MKNLSKNDAIKITSAGKDALVVTYAPWCKFCMVRQMMLAPRGSDVSQGMEEELEKFASQYGDKVMNERTATAIGAVILF